MRIEITNDANDLVGKVDIEPYRLDPDGAKTAYTIIKYIEDNFDPCDEPSSLWLMMSTNRATEAPLYSTPVFWSNDAKDWVAMQYATVFTRNQKRSTELQDCSTWLNLPNNLTNCPLVQITPTEEEPAIDDEPRYGWIRYKEIAHVSHNPDGYWNATSSKWGRFANATIYPDPLSTEDRKKACTAWHRVRVYFDEVAGYDKVDFTTGEQILGASPLKEQLQEEPSSVTYATYPDVGWVLRKNGLDLYYKEDSGKYVNLSEATVFQDPLSTEDSKIMGHSETWVKVFLGYSIHVGNNKTPIAVALV